MYKSQLKKIDPYDPYPWSHTPGHFIRYILLVPGWTAFCLQNFLNSSWHRFNKVLETFLRDFCLYSHDRITQLLQICRLHIQDVNLPFHHIPKVLYWIEILWLWRPFEYCHVQETSVRWFELCDMVHYPAGSSHHGYTVVIKGWTWSATILR